MFSFWIPWVLYNDPERIIYFLIEKKINSELKAKLPVTYETE